MLLLGRREGESIELNYPGGTIRLVIAELRRGSVRIGIEAPSEVNIVRDNAHDRDPRERKAKA